jgi:hypothetical protein
VLGAVADGHHGLGQLGPPDVAAVALHDRERLLSGVGDHGEPRGPERGGHARAADR